MPKITVVITAYNLQKYLDRCLQQLFDQTLQDFDLLIVDDCSSDGTKRIMESWKGRYPNRIKTLYLAQNLGMPAKTRNAALDSGLIDGECFMFLDGDDGIEPDLLERMYRALTENEADVAICGYDRVEEDTGRVLCREMTGFPAVVEIPAEDDLLAFINTAPWNKLWRREIFGDGRFPPFKVGEEVVLQFTRYLRCRRLAFVDRPLIHYAVRAGSVISNTPPESIRQFAQELASCYNTLRDKSAKDTLALMAFLHIGISMAIRAMDNREIALPAHLRWTWRYLRENYAGLRGNRFLRFSSLRRHGFKGIVLWGCLQAYRLHCFAAVLSAYRFVSARLHIDIKF